MENWVIVLLLINSVINSAGHRILDTVCITKNPSNNPFEGFCTYGSVVAGNDVNAERSYRRAARTRFLDHYPDYPLLENISCNISVIQSQRNTTSRFLTRFGFFKFINAEVRSDLNSGVIVDKIKLGPGKHNVPEKRNLTFGVFQCISSKHNYINTATVTITSHEAVFRPLALTITANLNETVELTMTPSEGVQGSDIRWRYSWNLITKEISDWTGDISPVIDKVKMGNAGVYEAYTPSSNYSGYVRLIVRKCPNNLWGPKPCRWTCPVCFNGGVCDDISGACICPPGFYGKKCEHACEYGKIGQQCTMTCSQISTTEDCSGLEICLPDPFGCTCAPGFTDLDCHTVCDRGTYGANCLQTCNCKSNQCDRYTGECTGSPAGCSDGWTGSNCQQELPVLQSAPIKEFVDNSSVTISWVPWNEENDQGDSPVVGYIPYYCYHSAVDWINGTYIAAEDNLTFTISDLDPDTRYVFSVAAVRDGEGGEGPKSPNITIKTICAAPVRGPTDVEAFISGDRQELVKISWKNPSLEDINCGAGVSKYTVYCSSGDMLSSAYETRESLSPIDGTSVIFEDLVAGNTYNFQVTLTTEGGESSWNNPVDHLIPILPSLRNPPKVNYSCGHEVTITWNGWTEDEDNGTPPVIGYIPYHKLAKTEQWIPSSPVHHEGDRLPISNTFTDLSVSVRYSFALSVVREGYGGEGDMGEMVAYTTIHCEPGLPTAIIIGSISGGLLLLLLSLFVILLIKKRRSTKRHPSVDKTNAKAMEDLKLDQMNAYENTGISNKEDEEYDRNGSLYEMPSVNPNSDNIRSNSYKEFRMCDADYKGESNSVSHYENI